MTKTSRTTFLWSRSDNRKSTIENPKWVGLFAIVVALTVCGARAEAQQQKKIPRVAYLTPGSDSDNAARTDAFRQGLRELGYVDGKTIVLEWRYADGKLDHLPSLAAELVRLKVDVIVTGGSASTRAAKEATVTIPIVMTQDPDPVGSGFIASLAGPGETSLGYPTLFRI